MKHLHRNSQCLGFQITLHNYIFYPIERIYLSERIPYLAQTFTSSSQK